MADGDIPVIRDTLIGEFDPFLGTETQTHRLKAFCWVNVNGVDITDKLNPHLISVRIIDDGLPKCEIEIDDRDAQLPIPPALAPVYVMLGWSNENMVKVFDGLMQDFEHGFGRKQGGRRMWVHAWGANFISSHLKTPMNDHLGEGDDQNQGEGKKYPMTQWLPQIGKNGDVSVDVHPAYAQVLRDYWAQSGESFLQHAQDLANKHSAMLQVTTGNRAIFTKPGENPDGSRTETVYARWRDNLIGWRVRPMAARSTWGSASQSYYSTQDGQWKRLAQQFNLSMPWSQGTAGFAIPMPAPNASVASQENEGAEGLASYEPGFGRIVMNGEPLARWNGHVILEGARPGVDGSYLIRAAEHLYSRQGYVTWLDVTVEVTANAAVNVGRAWPQEQPWEPDAKEASEAAGAGVGL